MPGPREVQRDAPGPRHQLERRQLAAARERLVEGEIVRPVAVLRGRRAAPIRRRRKSLVAGRQPQVPPSAQRVGWRLRRGLLGKRWSGWADLNCRPLGPEPSTLAWLSYTPTARASYQTVLHARLPRRGPHATASGSRVSAGSADRLERLSLARKPVRQDREHHQPSSTPNHSVAMRTISVPAVAALLLHVEQLVATAT